MPCIDGFRQQRRALAVAVACAALAACSSSDKQAPGDATGPVTRSAPVLPPEPAPAAVASAPAAAPVVEARRPLSPPAKKRNWAEVRHQAAERLVAANPEITYMGRVPDQLLAIPVLEIELNRDGSVRRIEVLREPRQAKDTLKIAVAAVQRAAPYGDVSHLPRPWKFVETFLFDDERKFKPRTLD